MTTILLNQELRSIEVTLDERCNIGLATVTARSLFHVDLCVGYRTKHL